MVHGAKETIPIEHYPSGLPITELKIDPEATVAELQAMVHVHMASEEDNLVRVVVQRWLMEATVGDRKKLVELDESDLQSSLHSLGIQDYTKVYVEGPLTNSLDGVGRALQVMHHESLAVRRQQQEAIQTLTKDLSSLFEEVQHLNQKIKSLFEDQKQHAEHIFALKQAQLVAKDILQQHTQELKDQSTVHRQLAEKLTGHFEENQRQMRSFANDQNKNTQDITALKQEQQRAKTVFGNVQNQIKDQSEALKEQSNQLAALSESYEGYDAQLEEVTDQLAQQSRRSKELSEQLYEMSLFNETFTGITNNFYLRPLDTIRKIKAEIQVVKDMPDGQKFFIALSITTLIALVMWQRNLVMLAFGFAVALYLDTIRKAKFEESEEEMHSDHKYFNGLLIITIFSALKPSTQQIGWQGALVLWLALGFGVAHYLDTIRTAKAKFQNMSSDRKFFNGLLIMSIFSAFVMWEGNLVLLGFGVAHYLDTASAVGKATSGAAPSRLPKRIPTVEELVADDDPMPPLDTPGDVIVSQRLTGAENNKKETLFRSGKREIGYSNGTRKVELPSGHVVLFFTNGDIKQTWPSNKTTYWYEVAQTMHTQLANGKEIFEFHASQQTERHHPDGTKEILYPEGIYKIMWADGREETMMPTGQ